jgi:hypothetical protein
MKVWAIGAGGGGAYEDECNGRSDGGYGGESVKTYSVTGGTISYSIGAAGLLGPRTTGGLPGGTTTLTYNGTTITAAGGVVALLVIHPQLTETVLEEILTEYLILVAF